MKIALFGRLLSKEYSVHYYQFFKRCLNEGIEVMLFDALAESALSEDIDLPKEITTFNQDTPLNGVDFLISIGGDGTFLRSARLVGRTGIPIIGINTGRLGFLADTGIDELNEILNDILEKKYHTESRGLIKLSSDYNSFEGWNYALNDISVLRRDTSSLIVIHVYIDDQFLNSYWADGLILSTPTGSTAYNMSAGGPIVLPQSNSLVITPIAPHSLTVRPLVVPDVQKIKLSVESRSSNYLVSVDSQSTAFDTNMELIITKADFSVNVFKRSGSDFYETLRNKLLWGQDKRNR